jgi:uncharacterized protein (DUF927 family)
MASIDADDRMEIDNEEQKSPRAHRWRRPRRVGQSLSQASVATRLGRNGDAFVLPDQIFGDPETPLETAFGDLDPTKLAKYRARGSLRQWQNKIAALCTGNSRLCGSWASTGGKIELTALAHRDGLLILDETKRSRQRPEVVTSVAFGRAELTEKERLTYAGPARAWRGFFCSTSNATLTKLAREGAIEVDDAGRRRICSRLHGTMLQRLARPVDRDCDPCKAR